MYKVPSWLQIRPIRNKLCSDYFTPETDNFPDMYLKHIRKQLTNLYLRSNFTNTLFCGLLQGSTVQYVHIDQKWQLVGVYCQHSEPKQHK